MDPRLLVHLTGCSYQHETREPGPDGDRLTDHSALVVHLAIEPVDRLLTSDPITVAAHVEPTLF
ncbi:hypothetical protein [Saccharothrix violaceirubra]|uniref:Uncharacterized protein n=1 Tax=Saccharothrix violaceirubra TaxID=413306 RepID=A0A7W7SYW3_9PSEU|nr:hypothetical protein [Saccharothrix violaceirubra]MBB4963502.1 hypothetical protein [Saccharothrix violaceirubra]